MKNYDFIKEYNNYSLMNIISKDFIVKFSLPNQVFNATNYGNNIWLETFVKKNKEANAVELMNDICRLADKHEVDINLDVIPMYVCCYFDKSGDNDLAKEKLEKYYSQFGFITSDKVTYVNDSMRLETDIKMVRLAKK